MGLRTFADYQDDVAVALGWGDRLSVPPLLLAQVKRSINDAQKEVAQVAPWRFLSFNTAGTVWNASQSGSPTAAVSNLDPVRGAYTVYFLPQGVAGSGVEVKYLSRQQILEYAATNGPTAVGTPTHYSVFYDAAVSGTRTGQTYLFFYPAPSAASDKYNLYGFRVMADLSADADVSSLPDSVDSLLSTCATVIASEMIGDPGVQQRVQAIRESLEAKFQSLLRAVLEQEDTLSGLHTIQKANVRWPWAR